MVVRVREIHPGSRGLPRDSSTIRSFTCRTRSFGLYAPVGGQAPEYGNVQEIWSVDALVNKQKLLAEKVKIREGNQNRRFLRTVCL